jgi:hypothetical protein
VCDGAADVEESGAGFEVQAKGGIEIPCEFCSRCACVEILNEMAVLFRGAGCRSGGNRTWASDAAVVGFILLLGLCLSGLVLYTPTASVDNVWLCTHGYARQ